MLPYKMSKGPATSPLIPVQNEADLLKKIADLPVYTAFKKLEPLIPVTGSPKSQSKSALGPNVEKKGNPLYTTIPEQLSDIADKHTSLKAEVNNDTVDETWSVVVDVNALNNEMEEKIGGMLNEFKTYIDYNNKAYANLYSILFLADQYQLDDHDVLLNNLVARAPTAKDNNDLEKISQEARLMHREVNASYFSALEGLAKRMVVKPIQELAYQTDMELKEVKKKYKEEKKVNAEKAIEECDNEIKKNNDSIRSLERLKQITTNPEKKDSIIKQIEALRLAVKNQEELKATNQARISSIKDQGAGISKEQYIKNNPISLGLGKESSDVDVMTDRASGVVTYKTSGSDLRFQCGVLVDALGSTYEGAYKDKFSYEIMCNMDYTSHLKSMGAVVGEKIQRIISLAEKADIEESFNLFVGFNQGYEALLKHGLMLGQDLAKFSFFDKDGNEQSKNFGEIIELDDDHFEEFIAKISHDPALVQQFKEHRAFNEQRLSIGMGFFIKNLDAVDMLIKSIDSLTSKDVTVTLLKDLNARVEFLIKANGFLIKNLSDQFMLDNIKVKEYSSRVQGIYSKLTLSHRHLVQESAGLKKTNPQVQGLLNGFKRNSSILGVTIDINEAENPEIEASRAYRRQIEKIEMLTKDDAKSSEPLIVINKTANDSIEEASQVALALIEKRLDVNVHIGNVDQGDQLDPAYIIYKKAYDERRSLNASLDAMVKLISAKNISISGLVDKLDELSKGKAFDYKDKLTMMLVMRLLDKSHNMNVVKSLSLLPIRTPLEESKFSSQARLDDVKSTLSAKTASMASNFGKMLRPRNSSSGDSGSTTSSTLSQSSAGTDTHGMTDFNDIILTACSQDNALILPIMKQFDAASGVDLLQEIKHIYMVNTELPGVTAAYAHYLVSYMMKHHQYDGDAVRDLTVLLDKRLTGKLDPQSSDEFDNEIYELSSSSDKAAHDLFCYILEKTNEVSKIVKAAFTYGNDYLIKQSDEKYIDMILKDPSQSAEVSFNQIYQALPTEESKLKFMSSVVSKLHTAFESFDYDDADDRYKMAILSSIKWCANLSPRLLTVDMVIFSYVLSKSIRAQDKTQKLQAYTGFVTTLALLTADLRLMAINELWTHYFVENENPFKVEYMNLNAEHARKLWHEVEGLVQVLISDLDNLPADAPGAVDEQVLLISAAENLLLAAKSSISYTEQNPLSDIRQMLDMIKSRKVALLASQNPDFVVVPDSSYLVDVSAKVSKSGKATVTDIIHGIDEYVEKKSTEESAKKRIFTGDQRHYMRQAVKVVRMINLIDLALVSPFDAKAQQAFEAEMKRNPLTDVSSRQKVANIMGVDTLVQDKLAHFLKPLTAEIIQKNSTEFLELKQSLNQQKAVLDQKINETPSVFGAVSDVFRKVAGVNKYKPGENHLDSGSDSGSSDDEGPTKKMFSIFDKGKKPEKQKLVSDSSSSSSNTKNNKNSPNKQ